MEINKTNINEYLNKFFEGETNREEERALSEFFRNAKSLSGELEEYREMFQWLDSGMREEELPEINKHRVLFNNKILWIISAAVIMIFVFMSGYFIGYNSSPHNPEIIFRGSYVCHGNFKNNNIKDIMPEIRNTLDQIDEMKEEIDNLNIETKDLLYDFYK